jgi:uncharacterized protein
MPTAITPITPKDRVWVMDALRGFALLGIFIANLGSGFSFYSAQAPNTGPYFSSFDGEMSFLHGMFLEGKFYSIFSFLFGWGIALQLSRTKGEAGDNISLVRRRLGIMFLLGLAHIILLWIGDIVAFYSLVGFLLLWMRKWKDKTLLITSIVLLLSPILLYSIKVAWNGAAMPSFILWETGEVVGTRLTGVTSQESFFQFMKTTDYIGLVKTNIAGFFFRFADLFFQSRISKVLALFILGYLMGRNGRYKTILTNTKLLWTLAVAGLVIGLPSNFLQARFMENSGDYYNLTVKGIYRTMAYAFGVAPLAIAYMSLFFLAAQTVAGKRVLSILRPVGKMAFSNYIFQSLVGTLIFTGIGWGYVGEVGPVYYSLLGIIVFAIQILISAVWLRYFEFGPVEWLWRTATYGKRQGIKRRAPLTQVISQANSPSLHQDTVN